MKISIDGNAVIGTDCHAYLAAFANLRVTNTGHVIHNNQNIVRACNGALFTSPAIVSVDVDV